MSNKLENQVKALVARHFNLPPSKVGLDAAFVGGLGGDALDLIELCYMFEEAFDILLSPSQRDSLVSCRDVIGLLRSRGVMAEGRK